MSREARGISEFIQEPDLVGAEAGRHAPLGGFFAAAGGGEFAPGGGEAEPAGFLARQAAGEEFFFNGGEAGEALHAEGGGRGAQSKRDDEAEAVLDAAAAGFGDEPAPVEALVAEDEPGEGLDDRLLKAVAGEGGHKDNGGVMALFLSLDFGEKGEEAGIAEGAEGVLDGTEAQVVGTGHRNNLAAAGRFRLRRRAGVQ